MAIKIEELADAVASELRAYSEEVMEDVKSSVHSAANACVTELKSTSPKDTGDYSRGWRKKKAYESNTDIRLQVHNATDYQLTHLLEDGHALVNGGFVPGRPHIGPAADNAAALLEKDVKLKVGKK